MPIGNGKPGTITVEEFESLKEMSERFGAKTLAQKVAKICSKKAALLSHEYPTSAVASAYNNTARSIVSALGETNRSITRPAFESLKGMVDRYGAEVVVQKLGKLASRANSPEANTIKGVFPRAATTGTAAPRR